MSGIPDIIVGGSSRAFPIVQLVAGYSGVTAKEGERMVGGWVLPPFQRPLVWTTAQKVRLIESIYLGLPIGSFIFNMNPSYDTGSPCDGWLLDGQQRLTAITEYMAGDFPVFGLHWAEVPRPQQIRRFLHAPTACIETSFSDPETCRDIYERLAYGGTPHVRDTEDAG